MRRVIHGTSRWLFALCLATIGVVGYVDSVLLDEDAFAGRIAAALEDDDVQRGLATQAVDLAFDQLDVDALLADSLPEEVRLAASPVLELSKPAVARAGAELLELGAVSGAIETAARSVHRQTTSAILTSEEQPVTINTRPVLVVTADAIIGPAGARAAVAVDLPPEATSVNLGSNQSALFSTIRILGFVAFAAMSIMLLAAIAYFVSATKGTRLVAARRLGWTMVGSGIAVALIGVAVIAIVGVAIESALTTDELAFGTLSIGGSSGAAGPALSAALLDPIVSAGRRTIIAGLALIGLSHLFGPTVLAAALRSIAKTHDPADALAAFKLWAPGNLRWSRRTLSGILVVALLVWPQPTVRVTVTLAALAAVAHIALSLAFAERRPWTVLSELMTGAPLRATDATVRSPRAASLRRSAAVIGCVAAVLWPTYNRQGLLTFVWVVAAVFTALYWWEGRPAARVGAAATELAEASDRDAETWSWTRRLVVAGAALFAGVLVLLPGDDNVIQSAAAASMVMTVAEECNGHAELCDRTLETVTFAGTHNSMSAGELGWEIANHELAIPAQLAGGIRALLIDVQRWEVDVNLGELDLDETAAEIARASLADAEVPEDGLWMCHQLCQLGATPFGDFLADLQVFLETNPDEVLIVVIQDDASADDIKAAIERAGLTESAYAHSPGDPWPTLREMIASGERVVFMAENSGDPAGWYQRVYDGYVTETGFEYAVVEDFDCAPNRGTPDSPFFLINHWVETGLPIPTEADNVNSESVLRSRVDECDRVRGRAPSIIAVNFWERGDLLAVVDDLNGVGP